MEIDKILVALLSIGSIAAVYWFFLMKKDDKVIMVNTGSIDITVEGGYSPNVISIAKDRTTILNFTRKDPSSCLEEVVLPEFKIRKYLPLNQKISISVTPKKEGTYEIVCGMNMFHGKIVVK